MELAKEKRGHLLYRLFCLKGFFLIFVFYHFQNMHNFTYKKALLHTFFCLFLKSSKTFSVSFMNIRYNFPNIFHNALPLKRWWRKTMLKKITSFMQPAARCFRLVYTSLCFWKKKYKKIKYEEIKTLELKRNSMKISLRKVLIKCCIGV